MSTEPKSAQPTIAGGGYLALDDPRLLAQCDVDCYRASGPGGQKRNKTSSAVRLRHRPTGLLVTASEDRSQHVNKSRALRRIRVAIALQVRCPVDRDSYVRSESLSSYIAPDGSIKVGRHDQCFATVISEVLDVLSACELRVRDTAKLLGISTARLIAFFRKHRKVWQRVHDLRTAQGLKPLK